MGGGRSMSQPQFDRNPHLRAIRPELDSCGFPWSVSNGKKHAKVFIGGKLALVISHGAGVSSNPRTIKNARAHIRRAVKALS
jgi:hypothetical protein